MDPTLGEKMERSKELAKDVVRAAIPSVISLAKSRVMDLIPIRDARDELID